MISVIKTIKDTNVRLKMRIFSVVLLLLVSSVTPTVMAAEYSLAKAIKKAQENDPWLEGSRFRQKSLEALSVQAGSLPDPTVSLGLGNININNADAMGKGVNNYNVGISQMFSRGNSLSLQREQLNTLSQMQPLVREDRNANTAVTVSHLWLEILRSQQTIRLIEQDRSLFEHLVDIVQSSYATASGRTRQQDLVRAQLELTRLEDRLTMLRQNQENQLALLAEWLGDYSDLSIDTAESLPLSLGSLSIGSFAKNDGKENRDLIEALIAHPKVTSIDRKIKAGESGVRLAKQSYKPQWGLNANYMASTKDDDQPDVMSVGISFDLPLFTGKKQDKQVQAAIADNEEVKTERALALRQLRAGFEAAKSNYLRLIERKELFDTRLLKEMSEQAEASLTAYTNDDGDFAEVVRARITELNAKIESLNIDVETQKAIAQINYFLVAKTNPLDSTELPNSKHTINGVSHE